MDAVLVINQKVDTVYRNKDNLNNLPSVPNGTWILVQSGTVFAGYTYNGTTFLAPTPSVPQPYSVPTYLIRQRAEKLGIWDDLSAYLVQYPALMLKTLTLETGIDPKDPDLIKGFTDLSMPQSVQDYLLSDPSLGV